MNAVLNVSTNPHARNRHDTMHEMYNVILALIPVTVFGIAHFGIHTLFVILASILAAMASEYIFDKVTHRPNSLWDGSAIVTGLLLALSCPPTVPLFVPIMGSVFGILFAKCFFGGLGQNFMNPALAGRAFLLISFGTLMTDYSFVDGVSGATPLATYNGGGNVNILKMFLGFVDGHIGVSIICLLLGGAYLLWKGTITWQIPVSTIVSFLILMTILGGKGFSISYLVMELCAGALIFGAFFMATDPVTSPMAPLGQIIFGCLVGGLSAVFRLFSNMADGTSYAIIIANLLVPAIDRLVITKPFGLGTVGEAKEGGKMKFEIPKSALLLCAITLVAGVALAGVNALTAGKIAENQLAANLAAFEAVLPQAESFEYDDAITAAVEGIEDDYYGAGAYGKVTINEVVKGVAGSDPVGYAISVSTFDGFEGEVSLSVGIDNDGVVQGISFTTINETPGMGMVCDTDAWKGQFAGKAVDSFLLLKGGGASADNEIDSVTGASTTSGAVVNAVNAALDFYLSNMA